jgi:hypothetical protein
VLWAADHLDDAQRLGEDLTRAGEESGSILLACGAAWLQANVLYRRGALSEAEAWFSSAVDTAVAHGFTLIPNWAGSEYATMLADRGDGPEALQVLRRLGLDAPLPDTAHLYSARLTAGVVRVACGQTQEGIDQIRTVGRRWEAIGARNPDLFPWRAHLAEALLLAGQREEARALADEHAALARTWGAHRPLARPPPAARGPRPRHPHPQRAAHRRPGRRRSDQPPDRPAPVHHPEDRRNSSRPRLPQAAHRLTRPNPRGAFPLTRSWPRPAAAMTRKPLRGLSSACVQITARRGRDGQLLAESAG